MSSPFVSAASGRLYDASIFGYGDLGAEGFSPENHAASARTQRLARSEAYFRNRQHDDRRYNWAGCALPRLEPGHQPHLSTAKLEYFPSIHERRPGAPYRLAPFIVRSFTSLLFGEGRFPEIRVVGDPDTQDFMTALAEAQSLPERMHHARNVGGSSGTVGISWRFWNGSPRVRVHPGSTIHCQEWEDREELVPRVVTEILQIEREVVDPKEGLVVKRFWQRRDWTPIADVVFLDRQVDGSDHEWIIDDSEGATVLHGEGFTHFVWIENAPDYDGSSPDGDADYEGNTEGCDALDVVFSATAYGGAQNLEPTLLLKIEENVLRQIRRVQKGSDRALPVGKGGDAQYLEISGSSISAGISLVDRIRAAILECCQVVAPDPDKVAAAGSSSVALKMLYAPMLAPAAGLRGTYGRAIRRLLAQQERSIRMRQAIPGEDGEPVYPIAPGGPEPTADRSAVGDPEGEPPPEEAIEPAEEDLFVDLPPRVVEEQVIDPATGLPTGEKRISKLPRKLGAGGEITLHWPDWFEPTADDVQKSTTTLSTAAGGKAVMSQKAAVEKNAQLHGLDPEEEWANVTAQQQAEREAQQGMFPPAGMPVDAPSGEPVKNDAGSEVKELEQATGQDVAVAPDAVLNGAQVQAALAIVQGVAAGEIPRDSALGQLEVLFNLQPGQALKILGSVGQEPAKKAVPTLAP